MQRFVVESTPYEIPDWTVEKVRKLISNGQFMRAVNVLMRRMGRGYGHVLARHARIVAQTIAAA